MTRLQFCLSLSCLQTFNSSSPNSMGEILFKYVLPLHLDHPGVGFQSFGWDISSFVSCRKCEKVVLAGGVPFKSLFFINVTITVSKEHLTWKWLMRCDIAGSFLFQRVIHSSLEIPPISVVLSYKDSDSFFIIFSFFLKFLNRYLIYGLISPFNIIVGGVYIVGMEKDKIVGGSHCHIDK